MAISVRRDDDDTAVDEWRAGFVAFGYGVIRQAVSADTAAIVVDYMKIMHDYYQPLLLFEPKLQSFGRYNDILGESVLGHVTSDIRRFTGLDLLPTYSFSRMYGNGAILPKHTDRPSCEVSATLLLGSDAAWPICVEVDGEDRQVELGPGDAMVYRGCDVPHWREPFAGQYSMHMFLHFVEAGGPYEHLKFDEREALGAPQMRGAPLRKDPTTRRISRLGLDELPDSASVPASRNDPCPCGSGKRFKHCHGARS